MKKIWTGKQGQSPKLFTEKHTVTVLRIQLTPEISREYNLDSL